MGIILFEGPRKKKKRKEKREREREKKEGSSRTMTDNHAASTY
jgi:hypothetical protein